MQHSFRLAVKPRPASRPRCACRGRFPTVYTDPAYRTWLDEATALLTEMRPDIPADVLEQDVSIETVIVVEKPKTTKRRRPGGDIDNHEKALWDALTKAGWWGDDEQITVSRSWKRWAYPGETAGYIVTVRFLDN